VRRSLGHRELHPVPERAERRGAAVSTNYTAQPRELPTALLFACLALIAIGAIAFAVGLSGDRSIVWRAFHVNFLYYGTTAMGALCLACALVIIDAKWSGPIRHVAEALASWVPISFVLFLVGNYFGREYIHTNWLHGAPPGKEAW